MHNKLWLLVAFPILIFLASCGHLMPKNAVEVLTGEEVPAAAQKAVDDFPFNRTTEVLWDSSVPLATPALPVYIKTGERLVNVPGDALDFEQDYADLPAYYKIGYVKIMTASVHDAGVKYVPTPALLYSEKPRLKVQKKLISLNPDGSGAQSIYVQVE